MAHPLKFIFIALQDMVCATSVTRFGDLLDFGKLFKALGHN